MNKRSRSAQSATSLDVSPRDDSRSRERRYLITMGIRIACLILAVAIQPYGWYTFVFAIGAIFLPYIAVVSANARSSRRVDHAVPPESDSLAAPSAPSPPDAEPGVLRIDESGAETDDERPYGNGGAAT
ncbi:DUF3099 domain-containing protein [Microbacterium halotolerans]|uniref:DUF3099 domain-containing protein n=1 Tax=Microbacterium halotolerans TaxID=246613 RepID=UPI001F09C188|nr:DUF3099 domain-containing protein [Microbacterium halotolerans]